MYRIVMSRKLWEAIKLADEPAYRIARKAEISPTTLSKMMHGIDQIKDEDPRVIAVGKVMPTSP